MSNEISFCTRTKKPNAANNLTFFMSFLGAIQSWFSRTALFKMEMERPAEHKCRLLQVETIEFDSDLGHRIIPLLISFTVSLVRPNRLKCAAFDASTLYIFKCVSVYLPSIIFYLSMIISVYCVRQIFILLSIQHLWYLPIYGIDIVAAKLIDEWILHNYARVTYSACEHATHATNHLLRAKEHKMPKCSETFCVNLLFPF